MIICVCKNVSERDITQAVAEGCDTFKALQRELDVGRSCGTCIDCARECFATARASRANLQAA